MDDLLKMMRKLARKNRETWSLTDNYVNVQISKGTRQQRVYLFLKNGYYFFTSVVMGSMTVTKNVKNWNELALVAWQRNSDHELVNFTFDKKDRLIGLIRHPAEYLDPEELEHYINTLANECDRFEYLLVGKDKF